MNIPIKEIIKQLIILLVLSAILLPAAPSSAQDVLIITASPGPARTSSYTGKSKL